MPIPSATHSSAQRPRALIRRLSHCLGRVFLAAICCTVMPTAGAQSAVNQAVAISQDLDQLARQLDSETANQILQSDMVELKQFIERATHDLQVAKLALQSGDFETAGSATASGLRAYKLAADTLLTASKSEDQLRRENQALLAEIESYRQAFAAALRNQGPGSAGLLDTREIDQLLHQARQLDAKNDPREAQRLLRQAQQMTISALTSIRQSETVVYSLEFRTPADEYRYERDRYRDYLQLAKQMLSSEQAQGPKGNLFKKYLQEGLGIAKEAESKANSGDHQNAITGMEQANDSLIRGLQLLGLPVSR